MAQRNLGAVHVAALLVSASYGVAFLLGSGEMAVHAGMAGSLYAIVTALGMLALALAAPTLWRGRELIWDVFGECYGPAVRKLVALLSLVWMSGVLAAQIHGGIAVLVAAGLPATHALAVIAAALLVMSSVELGMAAMLFAFCLLGTNIALLHALIQSNGLSVYLHAWPSFVHGIGNAPPAETVVTIAAIGFLVVTGSDYQQFVIAARRPRDAWLGCALASVFLMVTGFLPAATVVAAFHAGRLFGLTDAASAVPWIMLQTGGGMGLFCIGVILLAALGSGTAVTRAMACALEGLRPVAGRHRHAPRILIIAMGCAIASDGQAIVSTIISLNVVYVAAIGLLFVLHETGRQVAPRCAPVMMLSGAVSSLLVSAMSLSGVGNLPAWLPLPTGIVASACVLIGWHFVPLLRRVRS
ncbi:SSS family solute:Na+ symporter [Trinickia symbiotica]|uniref:Sodium:solute symporter n=1 Tax=Trinickia symbiotica TaxID=863227 RepID=A0A2N7WT81_9BURK|nr:sodium:solute symporter [Trinickia symbiotica]PMS32649.1 sodium:solute symporter [Trinickia symbiotica]PPK41760.1 SSS family solute:Na+ symporter [Trinickia symbiotica]